MSKFEKGLVIAALIFYVLFICVVIALNVQADMRLIVVNPDFEGKPVQMKVKEFKTMGSLCQKFLQMNNWHALLIEFDDFGNVAIVQVSYNKGRAV